MVPHIDDAPTHRLRLHPRTRAVSRHPAPRAEAGRPNDTWFYAALVLMLALVSASQFFTLTHVR
jgi:hypothetical protein